MPDFADSQYMAPVFNIAIRGKKKKSRFYLRNSIKTKQTNKIHKKKTERQRGIVGVYPLKKAMKKEA